MRKQFLFLSMMLLAVTFIIGFNRCKEEEKPAPDMALVSLLAGDIDLNAATAPDSIPASPVIVATFSVNVDPLTATSANITMVQQYDNTDIPLTISVTGPTVTITPTSSLSTGALNQLTLGAGIKAVNGDPIPEAMTRSFTTIGTFAPAGAIAHWTFENNADDVVGSWDPAATGIVAITYTTSRNEDAGKAATFDGATSIIEIPDGDQLIDAENFTMSFWVKTNSTGHNADHFIIGLGAYYGLQFQIWNGYEAAKFAISYAITDTTTASEDMWFPALATDNTNGGWLGWDYAKSLTADEMVALLKDVWLHVVYTYNGASKRGILYYNGVKMKSFDFNLWPDGDAKLNVTGLKWAADRLVTAEGEDPLVVNELAFGFIQSRAGTLWDTETWGGYDFPDAGHFKGQLDDVRIYHKVLTPTEIDLMYQSEKP
jgi:hypothetical protein